MIPDLPRIDFLHQIHPLFGARLGAFAVAQIRRAGANCGKAGAPAEAVSVATNLRESSGCGAKSHSQALQCFKMSH
jgi:hypothetical protein